MNTTAQTSTRTTSTRTGSLRRKAAMLLATVMAGAIGVVAAAPTEASAASGVTFCFKWSTGRAYSSQPVYLLSWNGSAWKSIRSGKTGTNGCATFYNTPTNSYLTVQAHTELNAGYYKQIWTGYTPYMANPGSGTANLGTGTVSLIGTY